MDREREIRDFREVCVPPSVMLDGVLHCLKQDGVAPDHHRVGFCAFVAYHDSETEAFNERRQWEQCWAEFGDVGLPLLHAAELGFVCSLGVLSACRPSGTALWALQMMVAPHVDAALARLDMLFAGDPAMSVVEWLVEEGLGKWVAEQGGWAYRSLAEHLAELHYEPVISGANGSIR